MKKKFEQVDNNINNGSKEVSAVLLLIVSVFILLVLLTKDAILGTFGESTYNFILGTFGFFAYPLFLALIIGSVTLLFSDNSKKNRLTVFSVCILVLSGAIALHIFTSTASDIYQKSLSFSQYIDCNYKLECSNGINGVSCGGVILSALVYFPVKILKIGGAYTIACIIFLGGGFGLYSALKKNNKFKNRQKRINNNVNINNNYSNGNNNYNNGNNQGLNYANMMQNANRVNFGARLSDLPYQQPSQTDFNGHNMYNRGYEGHNNQSQVVDQQEVVPPYQDARSLLYPEMYSNQQNYEKNQQVAEQNYDDNNKLLNFGNKDNNSSLFVYNQSKNNQLKEKSRKEIEKEEKNKKASAKDLLYPDKIDDSDFTVNRVHKTKNLNEDKRDYNVLHDTYREDSISNIFNNNYNNSSDNENRDNYVRKIDFDNSNSNSNISQPIIFTNSKDYISNVDSEHIEEKPVEIKQVEEKKKKKDEVDYADAYRITYPKQMPQILRASDMVKEPSKEDKKETKEEAKNSEVISSYEGDAKELKELISSGKIVEREIDMSSIDYKFDKAPPKDMSKIQIISNINQVKKEEPIRKGTDFDTINKTVLNTSIDEEMNKLDFIFGDKTEEIGAKSTEDNLSNNINTNNKNEFNSVESTNISTNTYEKYKVESNNEESVLSYYPIKEPKVIKTPTGETASQLPIYAVNNTKIEKVTEEKKLQPIVRTPYVYPPIDYLVAYENVTEDYSDEIAMRSRKLEELLASFDIGAKVVTTVRGPVVTRYELEIEAGTSVKRVELLSKDITMGLESPSEVIIQAPIPGKNRFGVEVPNRTRTKVPMRDIISSDTFKSNKSPVVFALGKDVAGKEILCDIKRMPHLLVAGSTGMGKSVCLNSLIVSLLYHASPEDVRIILIDPKRVEFNIYEGLPHLLIDEIINDSEKAITAFDWAISEMERRFNLFQASKTRDMDSYNESLDLTTHKKLPRIIIIVDEVSDLMSYNKKDLESRIIRIAQKARAAGIHLILATQRPSVDVITGVIKTNLPSRISFKLSNGIDSKTVLDETGAEKLLGYGDMFYKPVDFADKLRVQGCLVETKEVERIVQFVIDNNPADFDDDIKKIINTPKETTENMEVSFSNKETDIMKDEIFKEAVRLAIESSQISISMLQRKYSVGYARAGKMIDAMERMGYVSAFNGSKPREVFVTREQFERDFGEEY